MPAQLHWEGSDPALTDEQIRGAELVLGITFPQDIRSILRDFPGGQPLEDEYRFERPSGPFFGGIGMVLSLNPRRTSENLFVAVRRFPVGVVPITVDGGGNYLCLDYRQGAQSEAPVIVHYVDNVEFDLNFFFVARTFQEIMDASFIPEDVIADRLENGLFLPEAVRASARAKSDG